MLLVAGSPLAAEDANFPAYAANHQRSLAGSLSQARARNAVSRTRHARPSVTAFPPVSTFIDESLFGKMSADNVPPAPLSDDAMFLRRAMVDLTGRIPSPEQVGQFLSDRNANKRASIIDSLLSSGAKRLVQLSA